MKRKGFTMKSLDINKIKKELFSNGFSKFHIDLPTEAINALESRNWEELDHLMASYVASHGFLYDFLRNFHSFNSIEHILAIRLAENDEDGIWHDDGSRHMAFTWSLNEEPHTISGGELNFRKKKSEKLEIFTPPHMGTFILFLTGEYHYEHKVNQVISGERKTFAGWCSTT
jgi:hypothetical protein